MSDLRAQHLPAADRADVPWRNGAGRSMEVIVRPDGAGGDGFDWRVTIATVTGDTAFSRYPGVDRWLMPISPEGLDLVDDGRLVQLGQVAVHAFAGEHEVAPTNVTGPTLDLNLMVRRGPGSGSLRSVEVSGPWVAEAAAAEEVVVVVLDGSLRSGTLQLQPQDALLIGNGGRATLQGVGRIAVARIVAGTDRPEPATAGRSLSPGRSGPAGRLAWRTALALGTRHSDVHVSCTFETGRRTAPEFPGKSTAASRIAGVMPEAAEGETDVGQRAGAKGVTLSP